MQSSKRLGELVIRSRNAPALVEFYASIVGLERFADVGSATFFKVADDFEGHPQLLAVFHGTHAFSGPRAMDPDTADARKGTLHHFALAMERADFEAEQERLTRLGVDLQLSEHNRFGWRSLYLFDPDGNSVEFVCYDESVKGTQAP